MARLARLASATRVLLSVFCLCGAPLTAEHNLHVENLSRSRWTFYLDQKGKNLVVFPGGLSGEHRLPSWVKEVHLDPGQRLTLSRPTEKGPRHVTCSLWDAGPLGGLGRSRALYLRYPKEETEENKAPAVTIDWRHGARDWEPCVVEGDTVRILGDSWEPPAQTSATVLEPAGRGVKRPASGADEASRPSSRPRIAEGQNPGESKEPAKDTIPAPATQPGAPATPALRVLAISNTSDATWTLTLPQAGLGLWRSKNRVPVQVDPQIEVLLPVAESYRVPPHSVRFLPMLAGDAPLPVRIWDASSRTPRGFVLMADPGTGFTLRHDAGPAEDTLIRRTVRIRTMKVRLATAAWDPVLGAALEGPPQH